MPVIAPVLVLIFRPAGRPTAEKARVPLLESLALSDRETVSPSVLVRSAGAVSVTGLLTFQVNNALLV